MMKSTKPSVGYPNYGYLWGRAIFVSPVDRLVIVTHSMWPKPVGPEFSAHRGGFFGAVAAALRTSDIRAVEDRAPVEERRLAGPDGNDQ